MNHTTKALIILGLLLLAIFLTFVFSAIEKKKFNKETDKGKET